VSGVFSVSGAGAAWVGIAVVGILTQAAPAVYWLVRKRRRT
jgi:hypothetical protein